MRADGHRRADRITRVLLAALLSSALASCTTGSSLNLASPSYTSGGIASVMAEVAAQEEATAENLLPEAEVAVAEDQAAQPTETALQDAEVAAAEADPDSDDSAEQQAELAAAADGENEAADVAAPAAPEQKKRGFLASLFAPTPAVPAPAAKTAFAPAPQPAATAVAREAEPEKEPDAKPLIDLSSKGKPVKLASFGDALPGVRRTTNLFEITHKSGIGDDSDVDLYEGEDAPVMLASAAGLARLAPNGLLKQRESVDVACLQPELVRLLKTVERHFGKRMVITSGYRSPAYNKKVRGAPRSQHMYCAAADVQVPGVSKWEIAKLVRSMPGRGGVGTYCHTESVHIDVGPERDWNWRCRGRS